METGHILPMDITTEILSRLPVKSLLRFKCVSISFYNLISSDPLFRKMHLYHQSSIINVILFPSVFQHIGGDSDYPCPLLSLSPDGDVRNGIIDLQLPAGQGNLLIYQDVCFHNSCDGLFCISMGGDAVIWNPTTRQARRFRGCGCRRFGYPSWIGYSLAHDSHSDMYKLLGLCIYGCNKYRLFFYSSTWRYIEDSSCAHIHVCNYVKYDGIPTIVNGAFHWLGSNEKDFLMPHVVVSLDISDETYGTLALPQAIFSDIHSSGPILYELKGKLCIFVEDDLELVCHLWVMNKYGDVDSMMKMIRTSYLWPRYLWPFHMLEDDTLLIQRVNRQQIHICKDGRVLFTTNHWLGMDPYVYFESLISPHTFLQGKAFNHKIVANGCSAVTSMGKHVAKRGWQKSCLQRLCFCKSFRRE